MERFKFEEVYDALAKPLDNRPVPSSPFGPMLVKALLEDDGVFIISTLYQETMRAYFSDESDTQHLAHLIERILEAQADNFCMVQVYECYQNGPGSDEKGIALLIHHKTGKRAGCLPIDSERVSHYAPMPNEYREFLAVKIDAKPFQ